MEAAIEEAKDESKMQESEGDNLEAIKKFIEDQEKEFQEQENKDEAPVEEKKEIDESKDFDERLAVASSMMDMILSESEERIANKDKNAKPSSSNSEKGGNSMALSVGSKVEAKDFSELWYPANIVEVDYEEMEVLVRYENPSKKHDEWISVSSPRLRPASANPAPVVTEPSGPSVSAATVPTEEPKPTDDKNKLAFTMGERCLARWRDNRRFMATITKDLGDGQYEVVFDDGFQWKCATNRLHKLKDPSKTDSLSVDTSSSPSGAAAQSPVLYGTGPSNIQPLPLTPTAYHTHLFDPTRDYLGSKSERREMKRKLNIKEIFNIGQKKMKKQVTPKEKVATPKTPVERKPKPRIIRRKTAPAVVKKEIPDAVASIIGTCEDVKTSDSKVEEKETTAVVKEESQAEEVKPAEEEETISEDVTKDEEEVEKEIDVKEADTSDSSEMGDSKNDIDPVLEEEVKLEKFEKVGVKHEEVIDRIKEVINKLEDGINKANSPKPEPKLEPKLEPKEEIKIEVKEEVPTEAPEAAETVEKKDKKVSKIKKGKKLRLLQEKKVKKQVEKVKSELEVMKRQFEEMRQQMLAKTEQLTKGQQEMPESFLLPGEWCCRWVNGQPVGTVSELEGEVRDVNSKPGLPRRSVQVEDKRLPPGWTKHMVRRSLGNSAGKWDVVLVSPDNRRFHTRTDMRNYMANNPDPAISEYEHALMDFGVHLKLSRRMGWVTFTPGGVDDTPVVPLAAGTLCSTSPLVKRRKLSLKRARKEEKREKKRKLAKITIKMPKYMVKDSGVQKIGDFDSSALDTSAEPIDEAPPIEDGYVWVGSLKVQIVDNLLRCPAEGCLKNFRNNTLIQMHIKHYHRDLRKMLGRTPKVLDLAYARTMPTGKEAPTPKGRDPDLKTIKVKINKPPKREREKEDIKPEVKEETPISVDVPAPVKEIEPIPKMQDSPKLRDALVTKKRPRVLLPVRRPDPEPELPSAPELEQDVTSETVIDYPLEALDFETAISTHTVTKPFDVRKKDKKCKVATLPPRLPMSEDDEWFGMTSDVETRSSFPRSGTPDSKSMEKQTMPVSSESNEEQKNPNYMYTETGERIKIVHMKREEIINCHCGFREEDGLMVQCELCLCWQHALCHNIQKESEVPEKYTCSICLNPRRGRRSQRFLHDQDRLYEGLLPGARPCESLRRSHELSGNLHRIQDALHALRVKYYVATKKDHPKLYLWAKDWENGELALTQEKLNSDYSDLNIMIAGIGKENLPVKQDEKEPQLDVQATPAEEHDRYNQRDSQLGTSSLLSGLLSSPGASLDLPISTSELERLAKTVQEEVVRASAPQPEAAIENSACRERLLRHIQRCQAVIDARLDCIEAQVAELESQDPSFEDDETADYFPRTKQTIQMMMRDLDTMEELGVIT